MHFFKTLFEEPSQGIDSDLSFQRVSSFLVSAGPGETVLNPGPGETGKSPEPEETLETQKSKSKESEDLNCHKVSFY